MNQSANNTEKKNVVTESCFDWVGAAVIALVAVSILFTMFFRVVNVSGESMTNTLQDGERLILSRAFVSPKFGDIVVIHQENDEPLIKRVIGLPGDKIRIDDSKGKVILNGVELDEPYVRGGFTPSKGLNTVYTVPEGGIFVLGDNRSNSKDSRDLLGKITLKDVVGVVTYRLSPFEKVRNGD